MLAFADDAALARWCRRRATPCTSTAFELSDRAGGHARAASNGLRAPDILRAPTKHRRHYSMPQPSCRRHGPQPDRRRALKYLHPIYALVIASLMVPAVPLALMADSALAAEPQIPEDFQGTWCTERGTLKDIFAEGAYGGGQTAGISILS